MKSKLIVLFCAVPLMAADPPGFTLWTASDLKGLEAKLSEKVDSAKFSSKQLENYGDHYTMFAHREGNGSAELHEKEADVFVVETGTATLVVGGEMVNGKTTAPNEIRGPSIRSGTEHKIAAGDIVHIPPNTPHQLLLGNSKNFNYFVIKIK